MEANHIETVWIPYKNEEIGKHTLIAVNQQALTQTAREGRRGEEYGWGSRDGVHGRHRALETGAGLRWRDDESSANSGGRQLFATF